MLLTDEEIHAMADAAFTDYMIDKNDDQDIAFARAIEAAILAKLGAMELPEPAMKHYERDYAMQITGEKSFYDADQLKAWGNTRYAQGAAAQLAERPTAWSLTYNGEHTGNFNLKRYDAEDKRDSLNRVYPNDKREVVELYTRREAK